MELTNRELIEKKIILIYQHLGLGDHIICNGLIRNLIKHKHQYKMFVFKKYLESVSFMYRDIKNLDFIVVESDWDARNYINLNNELEVIYIGAGNGDQSFFSGPFDIEFDEMFYKQHNVDFKKRWKDFKCLRDDDREKKLFQRYNVVEGEYVFIHDDEQRHLHIRKENLNLENLPVIKPNNHLTNNIFDYCYLMENAKQCHFIDSAFKLVFDSICTKNENIFFHLNLVYGYRSITKSNSKLNFTVY